MAIWQFNIYFIPRQTLLNMYGQVRTQLEFEEAITIPWWLDLNIDHGKLLPLLEEFGNLQKWTSKTEGLRRFGDTQTNDISVYFDNQTGKVEELSCRLDLSKIDQNFADKVFSIAMQFDCLLMDCNGSLFQPSAEALEEVIQHSNAKRFVKNPRQFLDDLSNGKITREGI